MATTAHINLPLVASAQAQKHVTINEALSRLDVACQISVKTAGLTSPPQSYDEGDAFLVATGGAQEWSGHDGDVAFVLNGGWEFLQPRSGWTLWVEDAGVHRTYVNGRWVKGVLAASVHGAAMRAEVLEHDVTIEAGDSVTAFNIPPDTVVSAVTGRIVSAVTGDLSDWSLGVAGSENRYGSGYGVAQGAYIRGITGQPVTYYSATPLVLTSNGGAFAGGVVRLAVHLMRFDLPDL